jgi:predicted nucleic acid-binding protein
MRIIADAGFFVALINRADQYHFWSAKLSGNIKNPIYTCDAVLAESAYLIYSKSGANGVSKLLQLLEEDLVRIDFKIDLHATRVKHLIQRYENVPMDYADACIVAMTEQEKYVDCTVLTVDSKDFSIYRRHGRSVISIITPDF